MTRDEIINLAISAGFHFFDAGQAPVLHTAKANYSEEYFERFAALIAAAERAKLYALPGAQPAPNDWPMLHDGHLRALCFAYEKGFAAGVDERNTTNVFGSSGSQAAAFDVGLECGRAAQSRAQPAPSVQDATVLLRRAAMAMEVVGTEWRESDPTLRLDLASALAAAPEAKCPDQ